MKVSGILVVAPTGKLDSVVEALEALPGVDVHHRHRETGRIVVTIEAPSVHEEVEGLRRIKALPDVILAEMVHHHFEDDHEVPAKPPPELEGEEGLASVPPLLRD